MNSIHKQSSIYNNLFFLLLLCIIPLLGFWSYGLFDLDESYYANATSEMIKRGEWLVPYLDEKPWIDKPIMFFWFSKLSIMTFGSDFGARLPSSLFGLALCGLIYFYTKKFLNQKTALISTVIFGSSFMHIAIARQIVLDTLFTFFLAWGLFLFYDSLQSRAYLRVGSGICFAFCALSKSLIAPVFGLLIAFMTYYKEKDLRTNFKGGWITSIIVFLALCSAWFIPMWLRYQDIFWDQYILHNQFNRVVQSYNPSKIGGIFFDLLYFPLLIFIGFLPWSTFIKSFLKQLKFINLYTDPFLRFLIHWSLIILLFFTVVKTKNPQYIYAAFPAISIIIAYVMEKRINLNQFWKIGIVFSLITLSTVQGIFYNHYWGKFFPGLFASPWQLHQLARSIHNEKGTIILYKMKAHTTSHPLALKKTPTPVTFYANKQVIWANTSSELKALIKDKQLYWIFSFPNQIDISLNLNKMRTLDQIELWKTP